MSWIKGTMYALLLFGIYYSSFTWLVTHDWTRSDYSYASLIPLVVLYLIWDKRDKLASIPSVGSWKGLIPLVFGLALFWLGELGGEYFTIYLSSWFLLVGLCWIHLGWEKIKSIAFAFLMIIAMFPIPHFLYNKLSVKLQLISSQLGVTIIRLYGMSAYREGNVIDVGFTKLEVIGACSGLRYLISLIVLGLLLAYFLKVRFWKRLILVLSTIPLAILSNGIRIGLTGILYKLIGPQAAEGFFHDFSGWFIFMFSLCLLLPLMWILKKLPPSEATGPSEQTGTCVQSSKQNNPQPKRHKASGKRAFLHPLFIIALILLGATLVFSYSVNFREKIPIKKSFAEFPLQLGQWTGTQEALGEKFLDTLNLSDYVLINYKNSKNKLVNFYVAYYESQRKGESIHSPATCLPGSGWIFKQAGAVNLPIENSSGDTMLVNQAVMEKLGQKQLAYYWFSQRGRILTNAYQLKIFAFWDALTKHRTDGALVRIVTDVDEYETIEQAQERLQAFTQLIIPLLEEYIPGRQIEQL